MSNFTKHMEVNGVSYGFSFQLVLSSSYDKYFIKAQRSEEETIAFEMKKGVSGSWVVIQPAPIWIVGAQEQLSKEIMMHYDASKRE